MRPCDFRQSPRVKRQPCADVLSSVPGGFLLFHGTYLYFVPCTRRTGYLNVSLKFGRDPPSRKLLVIYCGVQRNNLSESYRRSATVKCCDVVMIVIDDFSSKVYDIV